MTKLLRFPIYLALASALTVAVLAEPAVPATQTESTAKCGAEDQPETGLQGQVPRQVQDAGFEGFWCNIRIVGHQNNRNRGGNHQVAWWDHCVYEGNLAVDRGDPLAGTAVIDVSNPGKPKLVRFLQTPGSLLVTESLHTANGLLVSSDGTKLDIYDISRNCARPRLKTFIDLPFANHGAWLSYDAKTWYGLAIANEPGDVDIEVVDLTNPTKPELLLTWSSTSLLPDHIEAAPGELTLGFHDMSTNKKGTRLYLATDRLGQGGGLTILDSTDIVRRRPNPELKFVSYIDWLESPTMGGQTGGGSHTAWLAHFKGKPYILAEDEGTALLGVTCPQTSQARTVDIADEENPEVVSTFQLEV
ncbi:MAG: LVIVD repeat-containing protein, partial [Actinomycetota bacterium]